MSAAQLVRANRRKWIAALAVASTSAALMVVTTALVVLPASTASAAPPAPAVTEFQPTIPTKYGGRTISLTVNAADVSQVITATESGGLFRSSDRGATWSHVGSFPLHRMSDVRWSPNNPSLVIATTWASNDTLNPGGVWRSTDAGATWSRSATPAACGADMNGWGIDFEPSSNIVYAGSNCGVLTSIDGGATFTRTAIAGFTHAVYARAGGTLDVCSDDGHRRYTRAGSVLTLVNGPTPFPAVGPGATAGGCPQRNGGMAASAHDLAGVPQAAGANQLYVMKGGTSTTACGGTVAAPAGVNFLYESMDAGLNWAQIGGGCTSRAPWVATNLSRDGDPTHFDLYYSGGLNVLRATCTAGASCAAAVPAVGASNVTVGHADPSQAVFTPDSTNCAEWVVSDGGVGRSTDCGATFPMVAGSGSGNGNYNGLQVYEVSGQVHPGHSDYVFGTQDNSIYGSGDSGATWPNVVCCEGFNFQLPRSAPAETGRLTFVTCGPCSNQAADPHLAGAGGWSNPSGTVLGADAGSPYLLRPTTDTYVQWTADGGGNNNLNLTTNAGGAWTAVANATTATALMGHIYVSGPASDPTLYQPTCLNGCGSVAPSGGLIRIAGVNTVNPAVVTTIGGGLNTLGSYNDGNGSFRLQEASFGVDPNNPLHMIAADIGTSGMKETTDGGATWTTDAQLTSLVTANNRFAFRDPSGRLGTQAHAIYFDPTNGNRILVGTESAGIIASLDGGQSWAKLPGSEAVPAVTSFFVDEARGTILVSSYGRGLWKLAIPTADLAITKSHHPDPATAGTELYYDLTVTNNGPDDAGNVTVTDTLPAEVTYVSNTLPAPAGCSAVGQVVTCQLGGLSNGGSIAFTIKVAVNTGAAASGPHSITNTATVTQLGAADPTAANNTATDTVLVEDLANLAVTKLCKPDTTVNAGEPIDCTVFVDNSGPSDARNVVIDDTMLSNGAFVVSNVTPTLAAGTPGCTLTAVTGGQQLTCRVGNVQAATATQPGRATLTYRITANDGQDINNVASVRSDTPDPDASNNQATVNLTIRSVADLALAAPASVPATAGGPPVAITITATNGGVSAAANVRIEDALPAGIHVTSVTASAGGTCAAGTPGDPLQPALCSYGNVPSGGSRTMTVTFTVEAATTGLLHNDARVLSDTFDPNTANDLATTAIPVTVNSDVSVALTASPNPVIAGRTLTFKQTVTNGGPSTATGVTTTLDLDPDLTFTGYSTSGGTALCGLLTSRQLSCSMGTLQPADSVNIFVDTTVASSVAHNDTRGAQVVAASSSLDGTAGNNSATTSVTVRRSADIAVVLTSDKSVYKPSTVIHYLWTVSNYGPSDAAAVRVQLTLPPPKTATFISVDIPGCTGPTGTPNPVLTCDIGNLPAGAQSSAQVNILIRGNKGTITSTATANSAGPTPSPDPITANNTSIRIVTVK